MDSEIVDRIRDHILRLDDPVTSAAKVSRELDLSKNEVLESLRILEYQGDVESKQVGANAIAWWHTDRFKRAPPEDPADHPDQRGLAETARQRAHNTRERDAERSEIHDACNDDPVDGRDRAGELVADRVDDLDDVLEGWRPGRSRQERRERRRAGLEVLRWFRDRDSDELVTRADVVAETYDDLALEGQSEDTFWRKTARPALSRAADAGLVSTSNAGREYRWTANTENTE